MSILVFALVFSGVLSLSFLAGQLMGLVVRTRKKKHLEKTFNLSGRNRPEKPDTAVLSGTARDSSQDFGLRSLGYLLITAGIPLSPRRFVLICLGAALVPGLSVWAAAGNLWAGLAVFLAGLAVPALFLYLKKRRIQRDLVRQMPDVLTMVVRSLKVGQSVDKALKDAADSAPAPFGTEIRIIYEEIRMGLSFDQAFINFEHRYPGLADVKIMTTAFIIQRETGGSLIHILEGLSSTIRKRFHFQRQIRTFSAEARISALVIGALPLLFVLATYIFNPGYIGRMTGHPTGRIFIAAALVLEVAGFIVMRRMAEIRI